MSSSRFFVNRLTDYAGSAGRLDVEKLRARIATLVDEVCRLTLSRANCSGGVYVGVGGVAYALWYLSTKAGFEREKEKLLSEACHRVEYHLNQDSRSRSVDRAAFFLGGSGVLATAALVAHSMGQKDKMKEFVQKYAELTATVLPLDYLPKGSDETLVGRAGYLCGILNLRQKLGVQVVDEQRLVEICRAVIESGRRYSQRHKSPSPLMYAYHGDEYLDAAHGLSGILQMLLSFVDSLRRVDEHAEPDVKRAVDYILQTQRVNGNFPLVLERNRPNEEKYDLVHWCHGAPGTVFLLARAYLVWKDEKYLEAMRRAAELVWQRGLLKKGPGVCHGVAGNAYVFLLLHRLTAEPSHLHRAHQFAQFLSSEQFKRDSRTPDCPLSLYEGLAGTLCFLADLCHPEMAEFPLIPVVF